VSKSLFFFARRHYRLLPTRRAQPHAFKQTIKTPYLCFLLPRFIKHQKAGVISWEKWTPIFGQADK